MFGTFCWQVSPPRCQNIWQPMIMILVREDGLFRKLGFFIDSLNKKTKNSLIRVALGDWRLENMLLESEAMNRQSI